MLFPSPLETYKIEKYYFREREVLGIQVSKHPLPKNLGIINQQLNHVYR